MAHCGGGRRFNLNCQETDIGYRQDHSQDYFLCVEFYIVKNVPITFNIKLIKIRLLNKKLDYY